MRWYQQRDDDENGQIYYEAHNADTAMQPCDGWARFEGLNAKQLCDAFIAAMNRTPPISPTAEPKPVDLIREQFTGRMQVNIPTRAKMGLVPEPQLPTAEPVDEMGEREAFEKWCLLQGYKIDPPAIDDMPYHSVETQNAWHAWVHRARLNTQGWQSIDNAPKGLAILIHYKNQCDKSRVIKARYIERYAEESGESDHCEYNETLDTYYTPAGWYEMIDNWPDYSHVQISEVPDAWQPLPTPPSARLTHAGDDK